jgi:hypothetical protein
VSAIGDIQGSVLSEGGSLLGSAQVQCNGKKTITLFDGTFEFRDIEPGTYTITASLKGFKSQSKSVTIDKEGKVAADFHLPEARGTSKISGIVFDAVTKKPLTCGTVILIFPIANRYAAIKTPYLNTGTNYEFDNLVEDSYNLITSIDGYEEEKAATVVGENEKKILDLFCRPALVIEPPWG